MDLLHPLVTLHWENCHTWNGNKPIHCAVLHDKVGILAGTYKHEDVLHISSTDLESWTTTKLPYSAMSLTTYQSKFVAVGGRDSSTFEPTNLLFSSDTGREWQESLPPMPTKRHSASSISTRSPEILVVAGGWGSTGSLDVVEVLIKDKWNTVDSLPTPCRDMGSTLHNGDLYFMGGGGQNGSVYTCSCSSLMPSYRSSTTEKSLWRQFKAPPDAILPISYSSRLVSIDGMCSIRAYSNMSQSWVRASSVGDKSDEATECVAAGVLHNGELVVAHYYGGIYRVKFSGERYVVSFVTCICCNVNLMSEASPLQTCSSINNTMNL